MPLRYLSENAIEEKNDIAENFYTVRERRYPEKANVMHG